MKIHDHVSSHHSFMYLWIIGAVLVLAGLAYSYIGTHPNGIIDGEHEGDVRTTVAQFGNQLNTVSLQSPTAAEEIRSAYESYVTPELLSEWIANPSTAPGRLTSSPWPDHIEVDTVVMNLQGSYDVTGRIMLTSSAGDAGIVPVLLNVTDVGGSFLISRYEENPGSAPVVEKPSPMSVTVSLDEVASALDVTLAPEAIEEDSRCPSEVQCIQAGTVRVRVLVTSGIGESSMLLTLGVPSTTEAETITLIEVSPYPVTPGSLVDTDYRLTFLVEKR